MDSTGLYVRRDGKVGSEAGRGGVEGGREEVNSSSARTPRLYMNDCSQRLLIDVFIISAAALCSAF